MTSNDPLCEEPSCAEVLADVWLFLDDEMDPERRALVQGHLDDCSPCLAEAGLDSKLKAVLREKCGGDRAPDALRTRLVAQLSRIEIDTHGLRIEQTTVSITPR